MPTSTITLSLVFAASTTRDSSSRRNAVYCDDRFGPRNPPYVRVEFQIATSPDSCLAQAAKNPFGLF